VAIHPFSFDNEPLYAGATLAVREENGYDDSDWYAVAWDADKGEVVRVDFHTTRWASTGHATVDATDDVKADAEAWLADWYEAQLTADDKAQARRPEPGKFVRSVTTRGKNVAVVGVVKRRGESKYHGRPDWLLVETGDGDEVFLDANRVEVLDPEQYEALPETIRKAAEHHAGQRQFHAPFVRMRTVMA
jgi:hypothetical protein